MNKMRIIMAGLLLLATLQGALLFAAIPDAISPGWSCLFKGTAPGVFPILFMEVL